MGYDWNFGAFAPYAWAFVYAAWVCIQLAVFATCLGTIIGIPIGMALRLRRLRVILLPLNDALRAIPILVLMFFFYLFPYRFVVGIASPSAFVAATLAMTLSQAVFVADLVRAAVDGVSRHTVMGARALGMREWPIWRHIIFPDILRQILPGVVAFFIANVKATSLASVIGVGELAFTARVATGQTSRNLEGWIIVAVVYVALVVPLSWGARLLERSQWLKRR